MQMIYLIFLFFLFQIIIGFFILFIEIIKKISNYSNTNKNFNSNNCNSSNYIYRCSSNNVAISPNSNSTVVGCGNFNIQNTNLNKSLENSKYNIYTTNNYVMTICEQKFYKFLKSEFDRCNINCSIFPQIDLERIIQVRDNNKVDRNRIKSRSIDFTIVSNEKNYRIICCIELDDYTHKRFDRVNRDTFINGLFESVGITLLRVPVHRMYDCNIAEKIKEFL